MKEAYKHDYSGSCAPKPRRDYLAHHTFSVGIFQWLPKSSGKGLKKSAVKFRVKGNVNNAEAVYKMARGFCLIMNNGFIPEKKSMTV